MLAPSAGERLQWLQWLPLGLQQRREDAQVAEVDGEGGKREAEAGQQRGDLQHIGLQPRGRRVAACALWVAAWAPAAAACMHRVAVWARRDAASVTGGMQALLW